MYIYTHLCVHIHICIDVYIHACISLSLSIYIYIHTYIYIYIYILTHIQTAHIFGWFNQFNIEPFFVLETYFWDLCVVSGLLPASVHTNMVTTTTTTTTTTTPITTPQFPCNIDSL